MVDRLSGRRRAAQPETTVAQEHRPCQLQCWPASYQNKPPGFAFDVPIMNFFTVRNGLIESDEGRFDNGGRRCSP
jgi:hypothetical protein